MNEFMSSINSVFLSQTSMIARSISSWVILFLSQRQELVPGFSFFPNMRVSNLFSVKYIPASENAVFIVLESRPISSLENGSPMFS